jgi:AcrR family transcriptional regulator
MDRRRNRKRLTREEWLRRALDVISRKPHGKLRIHELVKDLGVTRGSFYWHFKGREDFVRSVAEYWSSWSTDSAIDAIGAVGGNATERLRALMKFVCDSELASYDIAMRTWAAQEPSVAKVVAEVDRNRYAFVRSLFEEIGFEGEELEIRTRVFAVANSLDDGFYPKPSKEERLRRLDGIHEFFTKP